MDWILEHFLWNWSRVYATAYWLYVNIGLGDGLVASGNKPLPEAMLIQFYVA